MSYRIGLTGSTGSLGKIILKNFNRPLIFCFKGDIRDRNKVFEWVNNNKMIQSIDKKINSDRKNYLKKKKTLKAYSFKN